MGQPLFNYWDAEQSHAFRGNEIRTQESELGRLLSVLLKTPDDAHATALTLILPDIQLARQKSCSFRTLAIVTRSLAVLPEEGARQTYEVLELQGTA